LTLFFSDGRQGGGLEKLQQVSEKGCKSLKVTASF
jgi:hypothetical protein